MLVYKGNRDEFEVPVDSETDFASVPDMFQWLIRPTGQYTKAAVLHDYLWRHRHDDVSYHDADGIFRRAMSELGVPLLRRWLMWSAVRWASLWKSRFKDGPGDLWRMLLVTVFPGLFVIAGGIVVLGLLVGFWPARAAGAARRRSDAQDGPRRPQAHQAATRAKGHLEGVDAREWL